MSNEEISFAEAYTVKKLSTTLIYDLLLGLYIENKHIDPQYGYVLNSYINELRDRGYQPVQPFIKKMDAGLNQCIAEISAIVTVLIKRRERLTAAARTRRAKMMTEGVRFSADPEYSQITKLNKSLEKAISEAGKQIEIAIEKGPKFTDKEIMMELRRIHGEL